MSVSADRAAAVRILVRVDDGAFAARLLERAGRPGVRVRVLGVLRWRRLLDTVLSRFSRRPVQRLDPEIRAVLRIGLFEAVKLGVPAPVAVDAVVRLTRRLGKTSAAGLVNAILRRSAAAFEELAAEVTPDVRLSHPAWLAKRWESSFGAATAVAIMEINQQPADTWIWLPRTGGMMPEDLKGRLEPHAWCPGAFRAPGEAASVIRAVHEGLAYVQDPSSQLVAHMAVALASELERPWLADVCAAPGGKVALTAGLTSWERAVAVELRIGRACLMAGNLRRLGRPVAVVGGDALHGPLAPRSWDIVMLDAPCSGTGTLRRHPDLKWRLKEENIHLLAQTQGEMIRGSLQLLRPGGVLLYTTCSIEPEENEELMADLGVPYEVVPLAPLAPPGCSASETGAGGIRLLPAADADGFTFHAVRYNPRS